MSRAPRRQFLAPFILTAAVAIPGCKPKGGDTITKEKPEPTEAYRTWTVWASADGCEASDNASMDCPPEMSCNPPPMQVACPEGLTEGDVTITQAEENGPCMLDDAEVACPEELPYEEEEEEELPEDEPLED